MIKLTKDHLNPYMDLKMIFSEQRLPNRGKGLKKDTQSTQRKNLDLERKVVTRTCVHLIVRAVSEM